MTTTELLATFANSDLIESLSFGDKLSAGLMTTILGMGITFSALVILLFIITWMNKLLNTTPSSAPVIFIITWMNKLLNKMPSSAPVNFMITWMNKLLSKMPSSTPTTVAPPQKTSVAPLMQSKAENDNEIVAAITTAIAMSLKTSASNIVIRNIEKIDTNSPQWNKAGIIEQMNNRL